MYTLLCANIDATSDINTSNYEYCTLDNIYSTVPQKKYGTGSTHTYVYILISIYTSKYSFSRAKGGHYHVKTLFPPLTNSLNLSFAPTPCSRFSFPILSYSHIQYYCILLARSGSSALPLSLIKLHCGTYLISYLHRGAGEGRKEGAPRRSEMTNPPRIHQESRCYSHYCGN